MLPWPLPDTFNFRRMMALLKARFRVSQVLFAVTPEKIPYICIDYIMYRRPCYAIYGGLYWDEQNYYTFVIILLHFSYICT